MRRWSPTDATEMRKFLGIIFIMGVVKKPTIEDCWSIDPVLAIPLVNSVMPRDRFELLLKFWHFSNNDQAPENDRLYKLQSLWDALLLHFQKVFTPGRSYQLMNQWCCGEEDWCSVSTYLVRSTNTE